MPANKFLHSLFTGVIFLLFVHTTSAQGRDTNKVVKVHQQHPPGRAMLYSAIFPGLGQIYNKKYWKLPIIYVGLGIDAYFFSTNQSNFTNYNNALHIRDNGHKDPYYYTYSAAELSDLVSYYHRNRDLTIIIAAGIYLLNLVDANVDAQLHGFDVSDDISVKFTPNLLPNPMTGMVSFQAGFTLVKKLE